MYTDLAKELILQYGSLITKAFHESLKNWQQMVSLGEVEHKTRTKSNYLWDVIIHKLRSNLENDTNFHFSSRNGTMFIIYKQVFLIRVKKVGKNGRPSFIKTKQAENFQNQLDLGLGDYVNVYLNYSLDTFGIFIEKIRLQCENGNNILWSFSIDDTSNFITPDLFIEKQDVPNKRIRIKNHQNQELQNEQAV